MKFSYQWLQTFFAEPLPAPELLAEKITIHSSEVEELLQQAADTVLEVKVLPDKSPWLLSHRGLAKEIAVMLKVPLQHDVFLTEPTVRQSPEIQITLASPVCDFYSAALLKGVQVGPSPAWLKARIEAIGQRSINNIVDATNYVMFELGQPLHAFDAGKLTSKKDQYHIGVRAATTGESIVTLTGESYSLLPSDMLIIDQATDKPIGIAGVKGGQAAAVDAATTTILVESAHFDRYAIRHTAKRLRLQTDASKRYENGIATAVAPIALQRVIELILEVAGGELCAESCAGKAERSTTAVSCSLQKINSVLGLTLTKAAVTQILDAFQYEYAVVDDIFTVRPPFERDDIVIAEDVIEEIGRMYGLHHIVSIVPEPRPLVEYNTRHFYAEKIRTTLISLGFSEVYTSSFRAKDVVKLENALATDKEYLRSTLVENITEARAQNIPHRDLLGLVAVQLFEIGTVFAEETEEFRVALAVQVGTTYKAKVDEPYLTKALAALALTLGVTPTVLYNKEGIVEFSLDALLVRVPVATTYEAASLLPPNTSYRAFSVYPASSRDVALWVPEGVSVAKVLAVLTPVAGDLCVRCTHLDTFTKEGRTSYAFRLVFQSPVKTLTDTELQPVMDAVYAALTQAGFESR